MYSHHYIVPPVGLSGGLSLSWKSDIQLEVLYSSPNIIDTCITHENKMIFVSYVYGAPRRKKDRNSRINYQNLKHNKTKHD